MSLYFILFIFAMGLLNIGLALLYPKRDEIGFPAVVNLILGIGLITIGGYHICDNLSTISQRQLIVAVVVEPGAQPEDLFVLTQKIEPFLTDGLIHPSESIGWGTATYRVDGNAVIISVEPIAPIFNGSARAIIGVSSEPAPSLYSDPLGLLWIKEVDERIVDFPTDPQHRR